MKVCALCGEPITDCPADPQDVETDEHVPPLQFIPKAMRPQLRDALWKVPSHKRCNQAHKLDENTSSTTFFLLSRPKMSRWGRFS
jgi:hypothetical protein